MTETATVIEERPAIYVGTYHKYNCGSIEGKWLHLDDYSSIEEFYAACKELHKNEEDPEFMFQDREYIPESLIGESWLSERIYDYINLDEDVKNRIDAAIDAFGGHYYDDLGDLIDKIDDFQFVPTEDAYDHIIELYPDLENLPGFVRIDWESTERDFFNDWSEGSDNEGNSYYISND